MSNQKVRPAKSKDGGSTSCPLVQNQCWSSIYRGCQKRGFVCGFRIFEKAEMGDFMTEGMLLLIVIVVILKLLKF
jgi:hypothetical protein